MNRIIQHYGLILIISLLFCLPMTMAWPSTLVTHFWSHWLTGVATVLAAAFWLSGWNARPIQLPQIALLWWVLVGIVAIQYLLKIQFSGANAITASGFLVSAFLMTMLGAWVRARIGWASLANMGAKAVIIAALIVSAFIEVDSVYSTPWVHQALSQTPASFVAVIALGLVGLLYLHASNTLTLSFTTIVSIVLLIALARCNGHMAWLAIGTISLAGILQQVLAIVSQHGSRAKRDWCRLALILPVLYLGMAWLFASQATPQNNGPVLQAALNLLKQHLWLGVGSGNVAWFSFLSVAQPAIAGRVGVFDAAPNSFLQLGLEYGGLALLAVVLAWAGWLRAIGWRSLNTEQVWSVSSVLVLFAIGMTTPILQQPAWLMLLAFLLGATEEKQQSLKHAWVAKLLLVLFTMISVFLLVTAYIGFNKLTQAQQGRLEDPATLDQLQWADQYSVLRPQAQTIMAHQLDYADAQIDFKTSIVESALRAYPEMKLAYKQTIYLEMAGRHPEAVTHLKHTLNAYPIKLTPMLTQFPQAKWPHFLNALSGARPPKMKQAEVARK